MLHHAMDNYNYGCDINRKQTNSTFQTIEQNYIEENLHDCFIETNTCAVCQIVRNGAFYFSTTYGLDLPVCSYCINDEKI